MARVPSKGNNHSKRGATEVKIQKVATKEVKEEGSVTGYQKFRPRTPNQERALQAIDESTIIILEGSSGSGKTQLAVYKAVEAILNDKLSKIVLTRPVREAGESLGFTPGEISDKFAPYAKPLLSCLYKILPITTVNSWIQNNRIEISPIAYLRGTTLESSFVILDEAQNATVEQILLIITRLGKYSKLVLTGDITQNDLPRNEYSGLEFLKKVLAGKNPHGVSTITFEKCDNQRHPLINEIQTLVEEYRANLK